MVKGRTLIVAALLTAAVALSGAGPASASGTMSKHGAGRYYLRGVCPDNRAYNRFVKQIWHGRKTIRYREVRRRLPEIRKASRVLSNADYKAAKKFNNPPADWPTYVAKPIARITTGYEKESHWASAMGNSYTPGQFDRNWRRYRKVSFGTAPTTVRARLNLPAPGKGC